jgi:cytoskeleton protein RodZ
MEEMGLLLRAAREKRGLDLKDAEETLRISVRLLRALEEGDRESLPHVAYTKGFLRSYCKYLELSSEEIDSAVACLSGMPTFMGDQVLPPVDQGGARLWKVLLVLLVLVILGGGGFFLWQKGLLEQLKPKGLMQPSPPATESVKESVPPKAPPPAAPEKAKKPIKAAQSPASSSSSTSPSGSSSTTETPSQSQAPDQRPSPSESQWVTAAPPPESASRAREAEPARTPGTNKIIIRATEDCWIRSKADDAPPRQLSLQKGNTFALEFTTRLEIRLGNAGGVRIRYNGEELPTQGPLGKVRTLVFPPPPESAPSPSPSGGQ